MIDSARGWCWTSLKRTAERLLNGVGHDVRVAIGVDHDHRCRVNLRQRAKQIAYATMKLQRAPFHRVRRGTVDQRHLSADLSSGTLALVALSALMGAVVPIDVGMWAITIVVLFGVSTAIIVLGYKVHGAIWPALIAIVGFVMIFWAMFGFYSAIIELASFVLLFAAALWDRSLRRAKTA